MHDSKAFTVPPDYVRMMAQDRHSNVPAFLHATGELFQGIDLTAKRVLEIGSGKGLLAVLMGLQGAERVVSLEPEMVGATSGVIVIQRARVEALHLSNVEVVVGDFNTWECAPGSFDVIVSRASINHLQQSDRHALRHPETFANYVTVARRIHALLAPGGVFIATDACRYAFFTAVRGLRIRRPWRKARSGVNWRYHQNPSTWRRIFRQAGFECVEVDFPVPHKLRHLGPLVGTSPANFFLKGSFILRAYR